MNVWKNLFKSRKFMILLVDTIIALVGFTLTTFVGEPYFGYFTVVWGILQAPVVFVIGAIAYEDGQAKASGYFQVPENTEQ